MKKYVIIIGLLAFSFISFSQTNFLFSRGRGHIDAKDKVFNTFNNDPSLVILEFKKNKNSVTFSFMQNSYYNDSLGIAYNMYLLDKNKWSLFYGFGLLSGYGDLKIRKEHLPDHFISAKYPKVTSMITEDIAMEFHIGLEYKISQELSLNIINFGTCFTMLFKINLK